VIPAVSPSAPSGDPDILDDPLERDRFTRWLDAGNGARVAESSLRIGGMHCAACADTVEHALQGVDGVVAATVNPATQCASVRWQAGRVQPSALVRAVQRAGYDAVPDTAAGARELRLRERRGATWRLFVASFCAMQVMMMATPAYVAGAGELAPDLKQLLDWGAWLLTVPVLWFSAAPFFAGAWRALRERRIGMDVPVALGIAVAFVASSGAAFDPGGVFGADVYFDSLTMFVAFLLGGRYLEMLARHRAAEALERSAGALPQSVLRVAADGSVETISAQRIAAGDVLRVPLGQAFAADGVLTQGETAVDEALLSGESRPVPKRSGDAVVAGSVNLQAPVEMRALRVGADTRHEAIVALMREAMTRRPAAARLADRWAGPFLWVVLLLAAGAAAAWSLVDPSRAVWVAVSVLIVTCPCALSLAAPSALIAAAGALARRGVLLRRIDALETLAAIDRLYVDKTGTLTEGRLRCRGVQRLSGCVDDDATLAATAASLAAWSQHPLSAALREAWPGEAGDWRDVAETPGRGLQATDASGRRWRLGSAAAVGTALGDDDRPRVWLARDGVPLACFEFDEGLRADAAEAVRALQADGVKVTLLSGDGAARAGRLAEQLALDGGHGGLAPEAKLAALRAAQQRGEKVAMLGDGINDAPVLAQADVSLAMGEGALVARGQADGVVVSNALADVVHARRIAQRSVAIVRQNLIWAAAYNAACVPLAVAGWLPPWASGLGMAASSLLVVGNALRLAR
jgi:Cu2+-exporting ATPase